MAYQRIVSTAPIGKTAVEILERVAPVQTAPATDEGTLMGLLENTIALVARGEGRVTNRIIFACPSLCVIGRPGRGMTR